MADPLSIGVAVLAGLVSFLSPCVLPIIPGFLAYLSGTAVSGGDDTGAQKGNGRMALFINSAFFVLGFSVIFALLGVLLNTLLEAFAYDVQVWLSRIGGLVIIFFGLYLVGLVKIGFLEKDHKFLVKKKFGSRYATSFVFGAAFAAGWTPCVGAALGAILGLAASQPGAAFYLLLAYAVGLGIPFLIVGFFATRAQGWIDRYVNRLKWVHRSFGVILIVLGVLIFTQNLAKLANFDLLNKILLQ